MHLKACDATTLYSELEMYADYCKAISHTVIGVYNITSTCKIIRITSTCKIIRYACDEYTVGKGPCEYPGIWFRVCAAVLAFKLKLHENKHNSSV